MDLSFNLAPSYRDLKDPTSRQNFDDTVEQKRAIDLRACHNNNFPTGSGLEQSDVWQRYKISKRAKRSQYTTGDNHVSRFSSAVCVLGGTYH